jgi:hypothetical protein
MPPPARPSRHAHVTGKTGGKGVQRPALTEPRLNFSLLRLAVPERLAIAIAAVCLLWLAIAWALA